MSFTNYKPQLSWRGHDTHIKHGLNGTKGAAMKAAQIQLDGSLKGGVLMMDVPSGSINTETRKPADKTRAIQRGGV